MEQSGERVAPVDGSLAIALLEAWGFQMSPNLQVHFEGSGNVKVDPQTQLVKSVVIVVRNARASGWLGGPQHYVERFGHPRLRARHMPFTIGESERDQWMDCMLQAMTEVGIDPALSQELRAAFFKTADFMRNQPQ